MATKRKSSSAEDRVHEASLRRSALLGMLRTARESQGLTQEELAERIAVARMTVQRLETEGADAKLSTVLELARALNLTLTLREPEEGAAPLPRDLIHRGLSHNRTQHDLTWRDRQREAALAEAWQAANLDQEVFSPILATLIPGVTQAQASAVATVVQWLGSEVGFDFLTRALAKAGYTVQDTKSGARTPR